MTFITVVMKRVYLLIIRVEVEVRIVISGLRMFLKSPK